MELTYENMADFMEGYIKTFNTSAQDAKTTHQMDEYYAPDLELIPHYPGIPHSTSRDMFLSTQTCHPGLQETLKLEHLVVDDRQKATAAIIKNEFTNTETGELLATSILHCNYQLMLDENNNIKIKRIILFSKHSPEIESIPDLCLKDWQGKR